MIRRFAIAWVQIATVAVVLSVLLPLVPAWPCVLFEHFRFGGDAQDGQYAQARGSTSSVHACS